MLPFVLPFYAPPPKSQTLRSDPYYAPPYYAPPHEAENPLQNLLVGVSRSTVGIVMQDELDLKNYELAEKQLLEVQRTIHFSISEFPIEVLVEKMPENGAGEEDESDFKIPSYQREFTWEQNRQCKFIESVLMGLPIPFLFGYIDPELEDRTVIVDGVQRLNTLKRFLSDDLKLANLGKLDALEGFRFSDLSKLQQRRLKRRTLRMIVLENADPDTQFELFERINTTSKSPSPAEVRRGAYAGVFRDLVVELAVNSDFESVTPLGETKIKQREREELVARLFCYADRHGDFKHDVGAFINEYVKSMNERFAGNESDLEELRGEFRKFCSIAKQILPENGFGTGPNTTPRNRFEALAVGLLLEIRDGNSEFGQQEWISEDDLFDKVTRSGGSNSSKRLMERINFVRTRLKGGSDD